MVFSRRITSTMFLCAFSVALRMASATSLALPEPMPTRPLPLPTTTIELKLKRRPPFTTLAQRLIATTFSWYSLLISSPAWGPRELFGLKFKAGLPSCFGHGFHATMIQITTAVENDLFDSLLDGTLRDELAHRGRNRGLGPFRRTDFRGERGNLDKRTSRLIVDELGVDVIEAATNAQPRALSRSGCNFADSLMTSDARFAPDFGFVGKHCCFLDSEGGTDFFRPTPSGSLRLLDFLLDHNFVRIPDTLALVRLGGAESTDCRRNLANRLTIDALNHNLEVAVHFQDDSLGRIKHHRVGKTEYEVEGLALLLATIADTTDFEFLDPAFAHTVDDVEQHRAGRTVQGTVGLRVGRTG